MVALRFSDQVQIANPGSLRIALDVMLAGGVSDARNPTLMKMFGLINACEKAGSGFDVMRRAAQEAQAPAPEAQESFNPDRVTVTVYLGNAAATASSEVSANEFTRKNLKDADIAGLSAEERAIVKLARQSGEFTRRDVEELLHCGPTKAKGILSTLLDKDVIVQRGIGRSTRYMLQDRVKGELKYLFCHTRAS